MPLVDRDEAWVHRCAVCRRVGGGRGSPARPIRALVRWRPVGAGSTGQQTFRPIIIRSFADELQVPTLWRLAPTKYSAALCVASSLRSRQLNLIRELHDRLRRTKMTRREIAHAPSSNCHDENHRHFCTTSDRFGSAGQCACCDMLELPCHRLEPDHSGTARYVLRRFPVLRS